MARVLVTGAGGFVGRATVRAFIAAGWNVRAAARRVPPDGERDAEWQAVGDIEQPEAWQGIAEDVQCVVHLAGRAHVFHDKGESLARFRSVNVASTVRLAYEAARAGVKRFVFLSSIGVNGEKTVAMPFRENDRPSPTRPYAISKWEAEQALTAYAVQFGVEYVILRAPLVYGPGAPGNFRRLVTWIRRGWPVPFAGLQNKRSVVFVDNLADVLVLCAGHKAAANQLFLVADQEAISIAELVRLIVRQSGSRSSVWKVPKWILRATSRATGGRVPIGPLIDSLEIDSTHIQQCLGWAPRFSLEEGLEKTVAVPGQSPLRVGVSRH
jgi:nucleoside-diphosphate-sugar epimerase